ncbi:MAG: D-lyxose/D-mannose family sugar isomerase [Bacteroidota bacterium]
MLTHEQIEDATKKAVLFYEKAGLVITEKEKALIEIADFGLGDLEKIGLEVLVYVNTDRVCAKELVMFPGQTCPEHLHPTINGIPGKEETFRCRWGKVYLYVSGAPSREIKTGGLDNYRDYLLAPHEIELNPGEQYTIFPDIPHWFRAGDEGAVVSEFSTKSTDELDIFTDARINRFTVISQ